MADDPDEDRQLPRERRNKAEKRTRRKIFTLWNLFAVIGLGTVIVTAVRYAITFLLYLQTLTGGAQ